MQLISNALNLLLIYLIILKVFHKVNFVTHNLTDNKITDQVVHYLKHSYIYYIQDKMTFKVELFKHIIQYIKEKYILKELLHLFSTLKTLHSGENIVLAVAALVKVAQPPVLRKISSYSY